MNAFVNQKQLAELLGVTARSIQLWTVEKGFPREQDGKYHVPSCIRWSIGNKESEPDTEPGARLALYRAQTSLQEAKNAEVRQTVITRDSADETFVAMQTIADRHLAALAEKGDPIVLAELERVREDIATTRPGWETPNEVNRSGPRKLDSAISASSGQAASLAADW